MADIKQLKIIKRGVAAWNSWRIENPHIAANLDGAYLGGARLEWADLAGANLEGTILKGANLEGADLEAALLKGANLAGVQLSSTNLANVDLSSTNGLDACKHLGPSTVDHRTIMRSKNVPLTFWRGCGLPDALIDYMPSLTCTAIEFYSCFISYSSKDQDFAERLHADLQNAGVRCWFAPHDLEIGGVIQEDIDQQIRQRDKVILILSKASVASAWVTREVKTALEEEKKGKRVLFPIRLDDAAMDTTDQWAHDIKQTRNIGDFSRWKDHDAYKATLDRVLRDLKAGK